MSFAWLNVDFGARTPDHDNAINLLLFFEAIDVFANGIEHAALAADGLDVVAFKVARVLAFESRLHWTNIAQYITDCLDVLSAFKYSSAAGCNVSVVGVDVPCAPHDVVKCCQRNKIFDEW